MTWCSAVIQLAPLHFPSPTGSHFQVVFMMSQLLWKQLVALAPASSSSKWTTVQCAVWSAQTICFCLFSLC